MQFETPPDEARRIEELYGYNILDTPPEQAYDDIVELAAQICGTPMAMVSLIDADRQWFKSRIGVEAADTPRDIAFCSRAILEPEEIFTIKDAPADPRFAENPLVTGEPHVKFYAGAPLVTKNGNALGTLCVVDRQPRDLSETQKLALRVLARQVVAQLELRDTLRKMRESEQRYRHLFELSPGFINVHRLDGVIVSVNEAAANALGYQTNEIVGRNLVDLLVPEARPFFPDYLRRLAQTPLKEGIFHVLTKSGERRVWQYRNRLVEENGVPFYVLGYAQDITELKRAEKELHELSLTDDLTGLYNRRGFSTLAEQALRYSRRAGKNCIVIYADLDDLKAVNDRFGHAAGSQMIVETAKIFKSFFRDSDIIARVGGDEFVILVQDSSETGTEIIKERLQNLLDEFNRATSQPFSISVSLGIAAFTPDSGKTIQDLVSEADRLMYIQKKSKKNPAAGKIL